MSNLVPKKLPPCAEDLLARPEWFTDPEVVKRARVAQANAFARFLSSPRFSGTESIWAITLGRTIHIRRLEQYDPHTPTGLALLAHELKHVGQYAREGLANFLTKYLRSYASKGGYSSAVAFETEAYEFQERVEAHFTMEFANSPGIGCCQEKAEPHTPNSNFFKTVPEVFRFP